MRLEEIPAAPFSDEGFGAPVSVQSGRVRKRGNDRLVESGGRFKLFPDGNATLSILSGGGFFKWARGETPFSAGKAYALKGIKEIEVNGKSVFLFTQE